MSRLVAFDLDGTLVDSRRDLSDAANEMLVECGALPLAEEAIGRMVGLGAGVLVARVFEEAGRSQPPDALARFLAIYDRRLLNHTRPYPGIRDVLGELGGRHSLAVLTNKPLDATRRILAALDLSRYFPDAAVVGGDGPCRRKPDPEGLLRLAAMIDAPVDQAVLIGDSVIDWRTAHAAGGRPCLARYGFGFEGFPIAELRPDDWVIDSPLEVLNFL